MAVKIEKELLPGSSLMGSLEQEIEAALGVGVYADIECRTLYFTLIYYDPQKKLFVLVEEFEGKIAVSSFEDRVTLYQALYPLLNTLSFYPLNTPFIQDALVRLNPHIQSRL